MTKVPETSVDPSAVRPRRGVSDWTDVGERIRRAAAQAVAAALRSTAIPNGEDGVALTSPRLRSARAQGKEAGP